jgi:hypothetical protein
VDDGCNERRKVFLAVYEVGVVQREDCVFEELVAEVVANGRFFLETG